jgi:hypothetical protein
MRGSLVPPLSVARYVVEYASGEEGFRVAVRVEAL